MITSKTYAPHKGIDSAEEIRQVQQRLRVKADGVWGKATNIETPPGASALQMKKAAKLDYKEPIKPVYEAFKNFDDVAKYTKTAAKALAVVGIALDAYELSKIIYLDLNDENKKLGKKTLQTSVGIGASWGGGFGGAKLGAMGGIAGALGVRALSEYIV